MKDFGHLPQRNETTSLSGFEFRVLYSDNRQIHLLRLTTPKAATTEDIDTQQPQE